MKKILALCLGLVFATAISSSYGAVVIAGWSFDNGDGPGVPGPDSGIQQATATMTARSPVLFPITGNGSPNALLSSGFTISIIGTGLDGFKLSFDAIPVSSPTTAHYWYSTGGAYTQLGTQPIVGTDWAPYTVDFSGVTALNNSAVVNLRVTLPAAFPNPGFQAGFDNVSVVPEPLNMALGAFGLCLVGVGASRRVYAWTRS